MSDWEKKIIGKYETQQQKEATAMAREAAGTSQLQLVVKQGWAKAVDVLQRTAVAAGVNHIDADSVVTLTMPDGKVVEARLRLDDLRFDIQAGTHKRTYTGDRARMSISRDDNHELVKDVTREVGDFIALALTGT